MRLQKPRIKRHWGLWSVSGRGRCAHGRTIIDAWRTWMACS